jgi:glycosyltransferase involved in cell wall biosynthesis
MLSAAGNTIWSKKSYFELKSILKDIQPNVVHFHNTFPQMSPSVYKACYEAGVPVIQTLHNYRNVCPGAMLLRDGDPCELCLDNKIFPVKSIAHKCYRGSVFATLPLALMIAGNRLLGSYSEYVTRYIALTDFARDKFIQAGLPEDKIVVKPNFLKNYPKNDVAKQDYVVFVGRLKDEKGIWTLIKAWEHVHNLKLKILGDGELMGDLQSYVERCSLNVEFLGYCSQDKVIDVVSRALIQVIPSECYEGFPVSVLEAFAGKTPVIASDIGSLGEIIKNGKNGLLFKPGDSIDLIDKINYMINNSDLRGRLVEQAFLDFNDKYTEEANYKILMDIYKDVLQ